MKIPFEISSAAIPWWRPPDTVVLSQHSQFCLHVGTGDFFFSRTVFLKKKEEKEEKEMLLCQRPEGTKATGSCRIHLPCPPVL